MQTKSILMRVLATLAVGHTLCPSTAKATTPLSQLSDSVGCAIPFRNHFYSYLYEQTESTNTLPSETEFRNALLDLNSESLSQLPAQNRSGFLDSVSTLYQIHRQKLDRRMDMSSKLEFIASAEIGDRTTAEKAMFQNRIQTLWNRIESSFASVRDCQTDASQDDSSAREGTYLAMVEKRHPVVSGGIKALGVAYQSCEAMTRASLNPSTPDIRGITITGNYPNSPGRKREITNLSELIASHPYLSNYKKPKATCFDVLKRPMIYDFGGKPSTSRGALDFFTDKGGTRVLGIDCSGFVFASLATSGLRLAKNVSIKPAQVHLKNAALYMNPKASGLSCFEPISFKGSKTIQPGDIIASSGHIMIIDTVGSDPFGIAGITREEDCDLSKMTSDRFQMTYLMSGSTKGGIGISRIRPQKFLPEDEAPMDQGLREYAVAACRSKFSGKSVSVRPKAAVLVRHLDTPACRDKRVRLAHEDCIQDCRY